MSTVCNDHSKTAQVRFQYHAFRQNLNNTLEVLFPLSKPLTCETNHETYCNKEPHKARHAPVHIFRNMQEREAYIASNSENDVAGCKDLHVGS